MLQYFEVFKPFGMLSQFTREGDHETLAELFSFPKDVYPLGRLDHDSEGLLLLTNDKRVNQLLLHPKQLHHKTYWAQVEGAPDDDALEHLRAGVTINLKGTMHKTSSAKVNRIEAPSFIPERIPPVNHAKHPISSWIEIILSEGKNRQVRKMTAKVGHPTLRLIRYAMEEITIKGMQPRDVVEMNEKEFFSKLKLK